MTSLTKLPATLILTLLALPAIAFAQDRAAQLPAGPTPEQVKAASEACKQGLKAKEAGDRRKAIEVAAPMDNNAVAKEIASALRDKDEQVSLAAMRALGAMRCPESLKELNRMAKSADKKLVDNGRVYSALLRAVGQHGDKSSIEILADDVQSNLDLDVMRARIYGLGNIRDRESVEVMLKRLNLGNPLPGEDSPFMPDVRVALARLTGTDQSTNKSRWQEWWNKNKDTFRISEQPPELPAELQAKWDAYWGASPAPAQAGERGKDGEPGKDGMDGKDGEDGKDGADGKSGRGETPRA